MLQGLSTVNVSTPILAFGVSVVMLLAGGTATLLVQRQLAGHRHP
jgi:hypothetical protein